MNRRRGSHGLTVRDQDTNKTLFSTDGGTRLIPASDTTLLTSAAALDVLGPEYRYGTRVAQTAQRAQPTVDDPTGLVAELFARSLAKRGVRWTGGVRRAAITSLQDAVALALAGGGGGGGGSGLPPTIRPARTPPVGPRSRLECSWTRGC